MEDRKTFSLSLPVRVHFSQNDENSNILLTTRAHAIHMVKFNGFYYDKTRLEQLVELKDVIASTKKIYGPNYNSGQIKDVYS